jgi:hypothetical protein
VKVRKKGQDEETPIKIRVLILLKQIDKLVRKDDVG